MIQTPQLQTQPLIFFLGRYLGPLQGYCYLPLLPLYAIDMCMALGFAAVVEYQKSQKYQKYQK